MHKKLKFDDEERLAIMVVVVLILGILAKFKGVI